MIFSDRAETVFRPASEVPASVSEVVASFCTGVAGTAVSADLLPVTVSMTTGMSAEVILIFTIPFSSLTDSSIFKTVTSC